MQSARSIPLAVAMLVAAPAHADDSRAPRRFWLGTTVGMGSRIEPSEFVEGSNTMSPVLAFGLDVGFQRMSGGTVFYVDGDILPISDVYRARGAVVLGHKFEMNYAVPCAAPTGYSCTRIYGNRKVRSVVGLKLGGEVGTSPGGETHAIEVGLAFHSQISFDLSFAYDPVRGVPWRDGLRVAARSVLLGHGDPRSGFLPGARADHRDAHARLHALDVVTTWPP